MLQLSRFGIGGREGRDGGVTTWIAAKEGKGRWRGGGGGCQKKRNESEREKEREGAEVQF